MIIAKIIFFVTLVGVVLFLIFDYFTRPYINRYQINFLVGKPSAGKTLTLVRVAHDAFKAGFHVFSTEKYYVPVKVGKHEKVVMETIQIDAKALYRYQFPPRSVVLLDEVGLIYNNRNWKKFDERLKESWKLYRHDRVTYWIASQNLDADKVLRDLVTQYWLLERKLRVFTVARRLRAKQQVVQPTAEAPGTIQDGFVEDPKFMRPVFGGMKITFIPRWVGCYDSYEIPEHMKKLRDIDYSDLPDVLPERKRKKKKVKEESPSSDPDAAPSPSLYQQPPTLPSSVGAPVNVGAEKMLFVAPRISPDETRSGSSGRKKNRRQTRSG